MLELNILILWVCTIILRLNSVSVTVCTVILNFILLFVNTVVSLYIIQTPPYKPAAEELTSMYRIHERPIRFLY